MTRRSELRNDPELIAAFEELRREEREKAPRFVPLRWVREDPEPPATRRRLLAVAGALGVLATIVIAGTMGFWMRGNTPGSASGSGTEESPGVITVKKYVPPPSKVGRRGAIGNRKMKTRPLPVPERAEPRPIAEPVTEPLPPNVEFLIGVPEPPPPSGPLLAGVGDVDRPTLVRGSQVEPEYPDLARVARVEGRVILQAVVRTDGTVGDVEVLRANRPNMGFEESAVEAVKNWRYLPATQNGIPVDTYFTIVVEFALDGRPQIQPRAIVPFGSSESYAAIVDNPFHAVRDEPLSTFSIDVDTASYSNVRRFLTRGIRPPRDAVRVEELINYFDYEHAAPEGNDPFGVAIETADCPWNRQNRLVRIALAGRHDLRDRHNGANLVFLIDVSGSMKTPNKLPLVKSALGMLARQLDGRDTISIVVYAGASGLVLPPTSGSDPITILRSLHRLQAGGSTAGAEGLRLAYRVARENFVEGGVNRVILATDGDFNVGVTGHSELLQIISADAERGIYLTALGFGMGDYQDDRLEQLADRGNGNYAYIDHIAEARKVLIDGLGATMVTVARDVKIQVEFNPLEVGSYRLIGYENRLLEHRDFNDDRKDAGELGAGHTVTVLYELAPPGRIAETSKVDGLRYQTAGRPTAEARDGNLLTLEVRFKRPDERVSDLRTYHVVDEGFSLEAASDDLRFAAAVAAFGMRLRQSEPVRDFHWDEIGTLASVARGPDHHGYRAGFLELIDRARRVSP